MEFEDLFIEHFRVEKQGDKIITTRDPNGNYRARRAKDVKVALTQLVMPRRLLVDVKIGNRWRPIKR